MQAGCERGGRLRRRSRNMHRMNRSSATCLLAASLAALTVACTRPEPGAPSDSAGSSTHPAVTQPNVSRPTVNRPTVHSPSGTPSVRPTEPTATDTRPPIDRAAPASFATATFALG